MQRALATLLGLVALSGWGADFRPLDRRTCRSEGRSRMCMDPGSGGSGAIQPLMRILPTNGAGVPVMDPSGVCDTFAAELVGNYVCMRGDGTSVRGSGVTLTPSGAITTTAPRICPNGAACDAVTVQSFDGVGAYTANQSAPPAGNFSMCALVRVRAETTYPATVRLSATTYLKINSTTIEFFVNGTSRTSVVSTPAGRWIFSCGTYLRAGAGSSTGRLYIDTTAAVVNAAMQLPAAGDFPLVIGNQASTDTADVAFALYTEKELSAATVAAMVAKANGAALKTAEGAAVPFQVASTNTCVSPDGSITTIRSGWPCITQVSGFGSPALRVYHGATTNSLLMSEALNTWTASASTVTANADSSPMATVTADRIFADATTAEHFITRTTTLAADSSTDAASVFLRQGTARFAWLRYGGARTAFVDLLTGATSQSHPVDVVMAEVYAGGWFRLSLVVSPNDDTTNPAIEIGPSNALGVTSYSGSVSDYVSAWGAQLVNTPLRHPEAYTRTDGTTAATGNGQLATVAAPAGMSEAQGCVSVVMTMLPYQTGSVFNATPVHFLIGTQVLVVGPTGSQAGSSDGTNVLSALGPGDVQSSVVKLLSSWSGVQKSARFGSGVLTSGPYDGSFGVGGQPNYRLGGDWGGVTWPGYISDIAIGNDPNACN